PFFIQRARNHPPLPSFPTRRSSDLPANSRSYRNPRNSLRLSIRTMERHDIPRAIRAHGYSTHARVRHDGGTDGRGCGQEPQEWGPQPERSHAEGSQHGRGPKVTLGIVASEAVRLLAHNGRSERCDTYEAETCQKAKRQLCAHYWDGSSSGHVLSTRTGKPDYCQCCKDSGPGSLQDGRCSTKGHQRRRAPRLLHYC